MWPWNLIYIHNKLIRRSKYLNIFVTSYKYLCTSWKRWEIPHRLPIKGQDISGYNYLRVLEIRKLISRWFILYNHRVETINIPVHGMTKESICNTTRFNSSKYFSNKMFALVFGAVFYSTRNKTILVLLFLSMNYLAAVRSKILRFPAKFSRGILQMNVRKFNQSKKLN